MKDRGKRYICVMLCFIIFNIYTLLRPDILGFLLSVLLTVFSKLSRLSQSGFLLVAILSI